MYFVYIAFSTTACLGIIPLDVEFDTNDLDVSCEQPFPFSSISDEDLSNLYQRPVPQPTHIEIQVTTVTTVIPPTPIEIQITTVTTVSYTDSDVDKGPIDTNSSS